ncbi:autotransporter outer membrane beta-barrel domain-containing protein [Bartonella henselae]|uniref:autotransporter outer membrane beta-barrel domain-containing protein n=1 Tax=Bartonella henselae TaxID=38323 RepID=UPI0009E55771
MIKIFKIYFSLCVFTTTIFFFVHNADARVETSGNDGFSCDESDSSYRCNDGGWHEISDKIYHEVVERPANSFEKEGRVTRKTVDIEASDSLDIVSRFVREETFGYNILSGSRKIRKRESGEKESRNLGSAALGRSESNVVLLVPMKVYSGVRPFDYSKDKDYVFKGSDRGFYRVCPSQNGSIKLLALSSATDGTQCEGGGVSGNIWGFKKPEAVVVEVIPEEFYDPKKTVINEGAIIRTSDGSFKRYCPGGTFLNLSSATDKRECGSSVTDNISDNSISVVDDQSTSRGRSESSGEAATGSISTPVKPTDELVLAEGAGGFVLPERVVRSVVPQVPTYLLLPNNLFHVGLMDIGDQNKQLETLRMSAGGMLEVYENPALFLRGYGGHYRYASDLSALEYGYGGHLRYNAVKAGILLKTIESADNVVSFGVMGSYGKLSLQPKNVEHSEESTFDKWSITAYSTLQHDAGFYVDGLLSYGLFKGDVVTLARGKTATLKSKPLSVSLTGGQSFATGYEGFVVDPQVQVVYQNLQFDKARDIDNFDVEMGKLDQWVARVGGRLSKSPTGSEGISATSLYGKLYLVHGFRKKQSVHFKDAFQLGAFGSSLEAGLGFNTRLSPKFALHGDVVYQQKLTKAGFSGASFSGGLRYQF